MANHVKVIFFERGYASWYKTAMKIVTGCPKHHAGFLATNSNVLYDMSLERRHRNFNDVLATHKGLIFTTIDAPVEITEEELWPRSLSAITTAPWITSSFSFARSTTC